MVADDDGVGLCIRQSRSLVMDIDDAQSYLTISLRLPERVDSRYSVARPTVDLHSTARRATYRCFKA